METLYRVSVIGVIPDLILHIPIPVYYKDFPLWVLIGFNYCKIWEVVGVFSRGTFLRPMKMFRLVLLKVLWTIDTF